MLFKQLKVLSDDEIARIVDASFDVLDKVGCRFDSGWTKKQFEEAGCRLEGTKSIVHIPREKMEGFLKEIPRLDPSISRAALHLPGALRTAILDPDVEKPRLAITDDAKDVIRVSNALEHIEVISAGVLPTDVPECAADAVNTALLLQYSKKPFAQQSYSRQSARLMLTMAEIVYGGSDKLRDRGDMGYLLATTGPLRFTRASLESARMYASLGLPLVIGSHGRMGEEAPAAIAGAITMLVAEFMAGVAYVMVAEAPTPVAFGDGMRAVDSDGRLRWGGPEQVVRMLGARQVAEKLGFVAAPFVAESDSGSFDFLSGWEKCVTSVLGWAAKSDPFGPAGNLHDAFSIPQLLLDNEAASMIARIVDGIPVDEDQMALEAIEQVGIGGHFLGEDHTIDHMRDFWEPAVFTRMPYDEWLEQGAPEIKRAAEARARDILDREKIELVIDEEKAKEINKLIDGYVEKSRRSGCADDPDED